MASGFETRHLNDVFALKWIFWFGWLRSLELGIMMWPDDEHSRRRADRVIRGLIDRRLVIERRLPDGAGRAFVLSEAGAHVLHEVGLTDAKSGKDWGEIVGKRWYPPVVWKHDLIAAGVLVRLAANEATIYPERLLRRNHPSLKKIPDGLATSGECVYWIEVESMRKSGRPMRHLAETCCKFAEQAGASICGLYPNRLLVAYVKGAKDERGMNLNHRSRVTTAIRQLAKVKVPIIWAECELAGNGVSKVALIEDCIPLGVTTTALSEGNQHILKALNANGWINDPANRSISYYRGYQVSICADPLGIWSIQIQDTVGDRHTDYANTVDEAKLKCNYLIQELLKKCHPR